jgi:hypothetical protein
MSSRAILEARRRTVNTPGFVAPAADPISQPDPPPAPVLPNPHLIPPPPAGQFALRSVEGPFALAAPDSNAPRAVTTGDLNELMEWALPVYQKRHPRASVESMSPLLNLACHNSRYRFLRTNDATGLFAYQTTPWEPAGEVIDLFVIARDADAVHQAVRIYRAGLAWAKQMRAAEFWFAEDTGIELTAIAERLGCDLRAHRFGKGLM